MPSPGLIMRVAECGAQPGYPTTPFPAVEFAGAVAFGLMKFRQDVKLCGTITYIVWWTKTAAVHTPPSIVHNVHASLRYCHKIRSCEVSHI